MNVEKKDPPNVRQGRIDKASKKQQRTVLYICNRIERNLIYPFTFLLCLLIMLINMSNNITFNEVCNEPISYNDFKNSINITQEEREEDIEIRFVFQKINRNGDIDYIYRLSDYSSEDIVVKEPLFTNDKAYTTIPVKVTEQVIKYPFEVQTENVDPFLKSMKTEEYYSSIKYQIKNINFNQEPMIKDEIEKIIKTRYENYKSDYLYKKNRVKKYIPYIFTCIISVLIILSLKALIHIKTYKKFRLSDLDEDLSFWLSILGMIIMNLIVLI